MLYDASALPTRHESLPVLLHTAWKTPIAAELRLRVASSDHHASFESGSDLLLTNGRPRFRPLFSLIRYHPVLYEKLREERLVSDDLDTALSTLPFKRQISYRRTHLLYSLNDTFIVDFGMYIGNFLVITEQGVVDLPFLHHFTDARASCKTRPYTGTYANIPLDIPILIILMNL